MTTIAAPRWELKAKCLGCASEQWDAPANLWNPRRIDPENFTRVLAAVGSVCDGCPVLRECAADVNKKDMEVIRAGVPLPALRYAASAWRAGLADVFDLIAHGVDPHVSLAVINKGVL